MKKVEFVHIDRVAGGITTKRPLLFSRGHDRIVIYEVMRVLTELIIEMTKNTHEVYIVTRQLMMDGLDHFWFCLCFAAPGGLSLPKMSSDYDADRAEARRVVVQKILKWWPHLCARADRFERDEFTSSPLPFWTGVSGLFESQEIWQRLNKMDCDGVEEYLRQWLKANEK
jgi:hypothetical protein